MDNCSDEGIFQKVKSLGTYGTGLSGWTFIKDIKDNDRIGRKTQSIVGTTWLSPTSIYFLE